jgi:hypothetical protein
MKIPQSPPVAALAAALLVGACSDARNPAAPRPAFLATAASATTYSGRATVVQAAVLNLEPILIVDAGPLPPEGGADEQSLVDATVPGLLGVEVLHASTVGEGNHSRSEASVAQLALSAGGNTVSAGFLMARAEARCSGGEATTSGSSEIADLTINNQSIVISGEPNQTIFLPTGRVVINEQSTGPGEITVSALHVVVTGVADVVVSSAHADIGCPQQPPPPPPSCPDFVTGGGWITGTPSGAKGNFAVAGGFKNNALWGHLTYIDHGSGPKVKGTAVTDYIVIDGTTRRIKGSAEINGQAGYTYEAEVADNGEPGRSDRFALRLSNGYSALGTLDGGNIQLHTCH